MKPYLFADILAACEGKYFGDPALLNTFASDIVIDSRKAAPGTLYVPIIGEKNDGHAFLPDARRNGAALVLSDRALDEEPYICVENTLSALQAIGARYRDQFQIPIIGLTGSAGKTSTKDMIAAVLKERYLVMKTQGNLNNETGVPLTLFSLEDVHEAAVVEMGMNHYGEIDRISAMVRPDICLFTNIGYAHIENFGSREGVFRAKTEMLRHMRAGGQIVANGDDDLLRALPGALLYGCGEHCAVRATQIEDFILDGMTFTVCYRAHAQRMHIPALGLHSVYNALAAVSAGLLLGLHMDQIAAGLETYAPLPGRMNVNRTPRYTVIDDTYNANPTSAEASVDVLTKCPGRRVCILGDMLELGAASKRLHEQVGAYVAEQGFDLFLCIGAESRHMFLRAETVAPERTRYFETQESLLAHLPDLIQKGDTILVKASRGMHLEQTAQYLIELGQQS